ncbi:hypothetical protein [Nocardia cyriacigeorgica]|uniref:DoxX family protein n=1 Tax=Nocardia cyriacigeorgica TaxID=135487 RepID=A0A6P1D4J0_9NOCA|nr:hypothetical protein [Nocardia cyriacigeorgica]NEW40723.1 hypothetical protein [Nocardia cyriacigeorgica]NEW44030.1 hypothetical protein [Nocardia cyriacigeorgica]
MEFMDRARGWGGVIWVAIGLGPWVVWLARGNPAGWVIALITVASILSAAAYVARNARLTWWSGRILAILLGLELTAAVADRFGLFGPPGTPGVSWGSWSEFVTNTQELLPWLPLATIPAVIATVLEAVLGAALIAGPRWRWCGKAVAALFVVYALTMLTSGAAVDILRYSMAVHIGAALLVSSRAAWDPSLGTRAPGREIRERTEAR